MGQGLGFYVYIKIGLKLENPITNKSACRPLCANGDYLYFIQIYSIWLETLGAFKVVIFRSTSLKLDTLNRKLYLNFKNVLNLENPITTNESVDPYFPFF